MIAFSIFFQYVKWTNLDLNAYTIEISIVLPFITILVDVNGTFRCEITRYTQIPIII